MSKKKKPSKELTQADIQWFKVELARVGKPCPKQKPVVIEVYRGCASVRSKPDGIEVIIKDLD